MISRTEGVYRVYNNLASNVHLCKKARRLGLDDLARSEDIWQQATVIEALLGAIYLDSGYSISALMESIDAMDLFTPSSFAMARTPAANDQQNRLAASPPASTTQHGPIARISKLLPTSTLASNRRAVVRRLRGRMPRKIDVKRRLRLALGLKQDGHSPQIPAMLAMLEGRPVDSNAAVPSLDEQFRLAEVALRKHGRASAASDLPQEETESALTATNEGEDVAMATSAGQESDVGAMSGIENEATSQRQRRWRQRRLRSHFVGATNSTPIPEMLAKLET